MAVLKKAFRLWGLTTIFTAGAWAWLVVFILLTFDNNFTGELGVLEWIWVILIGLLVPATGPSCFLIIAAQGWELYWWPHNNIAAYLISWLIILALNILPTRRVSIAWFLKYATMALVWEVGVGVIMIYAASF